MDTPWGVRMDDQPNRRNRGPLRVGVATLSLAWIVSLMLVVRQRFSW